MTVSALHFRANEVWGSAENLAAERQKIQTEEAKLQKGRQSSFLTLSLQSKRGLGKPRGAQKGKIAKTKTTANYVQV